MVKITRIQSIFTALAVGDAVGMPTEFTTRVSIKKQYPSLVPGLLDTAFSQNHSNLTFSSVTDDTEQNIYLYRLYREAGRVDAAQTAHCLLRWVEETDAVQKRYIGPSSLAALTAIRAGTSVEYAGRNGTTCGGIMRTPAAVLWREHASEGELAHDIFQCLLCTHNTSEALEAGGAYGFALHAALHGARREEILSAAIRGAAKLMAFAPEMHCAPSSAERIRFMDRYAATCSPEQLLDDVYAVFGAGLPSADVCGAVFAIFFCAQDDVWKAIQMGASIGGDTDTIAALAGALCCAYAGCSNIPPEVEDAVFKHNPILHGDPWTQHDEPV